MNRTKNSHRSTYHNPDFYMRPSIIFNIDITCLTNLNNILAYDETKPEKYIEQMHRNFVVCPPTRILVLKNILQKEDLEIEEECEEIADDLKLKLAEFGELISIYIHRGPQTSKRLPDACIGRVYVEYDTIQEARNARKAVTKLLYKSRIVECEYFREKFW